MTKRFSSKVLAVILTLAICATTVLGCLMTVSAAESCYSFGAPKFPSKDDLSQVSIDVTFTAPASLPNGISAGRFEVKEVNADADDYLTLKEVNVVTSGVSAGIEGGKVVFDGERNSTVTLTLVFGFSKKEATRGRDYNVTLNNVELACNDDEYYKETADGPVAKITTACQHVVTVVGEPIAVDKANDYSVYAGSVCTLCGEEFGIQLVPTAEKLVTDADKDELNVVYIETSGAANINAPDGSFMDGTHGTGTENDPYIISNLSQLRYLAQKTTYAQTHGKFFEIDESIDIMVLQKKEYIGDLDAFLALDAAGTKAFLSNATNRTQWQGGTSNDKDCFAGTLNGNGVRIVGAYNTNGGIIAYVNDGATAKNLTVEHCYFSTGWFTGSIFGYSYPSKTLSDTGLSNTNCPGVVTFDGITVHDNYSEASSTGKNARPSMGALFGSCATYIGVSVNNCIVYDNKLMAQSGDDYVNHPYAFGNLSSGHNGDTKYPNGSYKNSIFIGCAPYAYTASNQAFKYYYYTNVYTDQPNATDYVASSWYTWDKYDITVVSTANLKGSKAAVNATKLDWGKTWLVGEDGQYPYLAPADYTTDTIYWNGDVTAINSTAAGTKDDPIIISTAAELAWLVSQKYSADVDGKYFKVADGIKNIVLQPYAYGADIMALDSAAATKAYFENGSSFLKWKTTGWDSASFTGYFDGNGVNIYGMYAVSTNNAALFCEVDGGSAITNLAVKNSYVTSSANDYQVGALIALSSNSGYGAKRSGMIWVKNVEISNNYIYNGCLSKETSRSGVLAGSIADAIQVENVLVYGNDATYGRGDEIYNMPLIAGLQNGIVAGENHYDGLVPKTVVDNGKTLYYNQVKNSIILGANVANVREARGYRKNDGGCFTNVYTDGVTGEVTFTDGKFTYTEAQVKAITVADAKGPDAAENLSGLVWGTEWFCGADGKMPILAPFASAADTAGISNVSSADLQLVGSSVNYNNDGTLNFNLHFVPNKAGVNALLYVGTSDATKFYKLEGTKSSYSNELGENAVMFSIPNLSARDIDKTWLSTVVTTGSYVQWGLTQPTALVDNAKAILAGNYDSADKQVAAALINYNMSSDAALNITTDTSVKKTKVVYYNGGAGVEPTTLLDPSQPNSITNPIIINTPNEMLWLAKEGYASTKGKFYKVADDIKAFVLQTKDKFDKHGGFDSISKLDKDGVKSLYDDPNKKGIISSENKLTTGPVTTNKTSQGVDWQNWNIATTNATNCFEGYFDGNGVNIYGFYSEVGNFGLFGSLKGATVKNINIDGAYARAYYGGLIGASYYSNSVDWTLATTIENITIKNSCVISYRPIGNTTATKASGDTYTSVGLMLGGMTSVLLRVNNCIATDNIAYNFLYDGRDEAAPQGELTDIYDYKTNGNTLSLIGSFANGDYNGNPKATVTNTVSIGNYIHVSPKHNWDNNGGRPTAFSNCYTNMPTTYATGLAFANTTDSANKVNYTDAQIKRITDLNTIKGTNAASTLALDFNSGWVVTSGYPQPLQNGYVAPATGGITIYWDGTNKAPASTAAGTKDDPIIINNAAELKYVLRHAGPSVTTGKYYKIANGISTIVLQPEGVLNVDKLLDCKDGAAVYTYFNTLNKSTLKTWDGGAVFNGNIDGNGAMVVGLYDETTNLAGLVGCYDGGKAGTKESPAVDNVGNTIRNFTVGYSYMVSAGRLGALGSQAYSNGYGAYVAGVWNVNTCAVINCYMENTAKNYNSGYSGIVTGDAATDVIKLNNIIVYGNKAFSSVDGKDIWMRANSLTNQKIWVDGVETDAINYPTISNAIVLGATPYRTDWKDDNNHGPHLYSNVYTDAPVGTVTLNNNTTVTFTEEQIKSISDLKGANAQAAVDSLNAANGSTVWYVGAMDDMPGFKKAGNVPTKYQSSIDAITFDTYDVVGNGTEYYESGSMKFGVYQTALSLKANPYMSFAFAFGGEYKENRDKIKIRFTYTVDGVLTTSEEIAVPAYTGADIKNVNGWTNTTANGRFHTYKAECIPVKALANGIKVEASYNGGAWADLGTYSVEGLGMQFETLSKTQPGEYYTTRVDATKALLFYAQAIAARYGA